MNLNKRSTYEKFNNFSDLLSEDSVIYVNAKNSGLAFRKIEEIFEFCKEKKIHPKNIYMDISKSKDLIHKPFLSKLLLEEENVDIITYSTGDVNPFGTGDYFDINRYLKESNLGIYDLRYESYSVERAPMLVWLG